MLAKKDQLLAHYRLVEQIGEGGMGLVWKAWDEHLDREVAVKVLPPGALCDENARRRFRKEARALSRINHANIATIHDFDTQDGIDFLVMEHVPGISLSEQLESGPLDEHEVLRLGTQLLAGLVAAHDQGILHRDLKPGNIRVTPDGQLKILDFGLAKRIRPIGPDDPTETMTRAGTVVGTLAYMAPEQLRGESVDERTDVYAAGAVLYEMATGVRMHPAPESVQLIESILHGTPKPPGELRAGLSAELERIVLKSTAREARARHASARELKDEVTGMSRPTPEPLSNGSHGPSRRLVTGVSILALLTAVVLLAWLVHPFLGEQTSLPTAPGRLKIVIMPFENLGPPEHVYFADGVTEEITSRLAAVRGLGVISRKSAVQYARSDKTTRQIGEELGVSYILAGTVRWAPGAGGRDRVKICPQLVRVADDTNVWAGTYDQVIEDIFEVQSVIAQGVVQQLGVALQAHEHAAVEIRPTENLDAYHAYLRGLYHASQPHFTISNWKQVLESFERAVTLDPKFAKAWSKLAMAHARFYYYQADTSLERRELAREAAHRALELAPEAPETHVALGDYYRWVERDPERALEEFSLAEGGLPNDVDLLHARGTLLQAMGRWSEAQDMLERAFALSPRDTALTADLVFLYYPTRQYEKAMEFSDRTISLAGAADSQAWGYLGRAYVHWSWKGALPQARAALENVPLDHDFAIWSWYWQEMYEGRYKDARQRLKLTPGGWIRNKIVARPAALLSGLARDAEGDAEGSRAAYESARATLEEALEEDPDDPRLHSSLGIAFAALGREEEAIREGARAVTLYPLSRDAFYGIPYVLDMALIYTLVGQYDAACERLEHLLSVPSWLSPALLEMDPRWDRLRDHRRFQKLLESPDSDSRSG